MRSSPVGKLESRIIIDSMHLGRYMGISDLMVEAPPQETNDATGGTTESGISGSHGLVFSGTPKSADFDHRVSVSVDLSIAPDDQATLVFTPTGVLTGPDTANQSVPDDKRDAVLHAFSARLPNQRLPFGVAPNTEGARGSDVIIEGITYGSNRQPSTGSNSHDDRHRRDRSGGRRGSRQGGCEPRSGTSGSSSGPARPTPQTWLPRGPTVVHFSAPWCGP